MFTPSGGLAYWAVGKTPNVRASHQEGTADRDELAGLVEAGYSTYRIARLQDTSQTNVRYWLAKYGIVLTRRSHRCTLCGETDPSHFYGTKKQICARCDNQYTVDQSRRTAARARAEMGGRCCLCSYDTYPVALVLHHVDPKTKDPNFSRMKGWSWDRVEREMMKCVLLCANCHAGVHAGLATVPDTVRLGVTTGV